MDDENYNFDDKVGTDEEERDWRSYSRMIDSGYLTSSAQSREIRITEFSDSRINPTPLLLEESDILLEQYLSPGKLQLLTGMDDLKTVQSLELKVGSRETSLGNFGSLLPNLVELKLNGSHVACMRDLGSSLQKLKVLWMTRCGLQELDGISAMSDLKELYLEYNEISDVSPLAMLEHLEILDLEGNNIEDITQVQYLSLCPTLRKLALDGNPICPGDNFRETIKKLLPNLVILDDERLDDAAPSSSKHNVFDEDWAYLEELQDEALMHDENTNQQDETMAANNPPPTATLRPATAYRPGSVLRPSSGFRPVSTPSRPSTASGIIRSHNRPGTSASDRPASSDTFEGIDSVSELTMGTVICGNPSKALRQRRQEKPGSKEDIDRKLSKLLQKGATFSLTEGADPLTTEEEGQTSSIIEELRVWKLEHDKRMELILKSKEAQILIVNHEDEDSNELSDEFDDDDSDFSMDDDEKNAIMYLMDKYNYQPSYLPQRHSDVQQCKTETSKATKKGSSAKNFGGKGPEDALETSPDHSPVAADFSGHCRYDQSFDFEDDNLDSSDLGSESTASSSTLSLQHQSKFQSGILREISPEVSRSVHKRSVSRDQGEGRLAPLRAPSPASAQVINKMKPKITEAHPQRQKKLRVGPTGLPLTSQTQQPVIRNNMAVIQSKSGLVQSCLPASLQSNIVLLPSQPKIQRHLPEPPSLTPNPPSN